MVEEEGDRDCFPYFPSPGYKFNPSDEELVNFFLLNRVNQNLFPNQWIIQDCDVYGEKEPWQIWESLGGATCNDNGFLYVFSFLKKKKKGSSNYHRSVGSSGGTWHGVSRGKSFRLGEISWTRKSFSYRNENNRFEHGRWLMQEYTLDDPHGSNSTKIALCRIKNNHKKRRSIELEEEDENDGIVPGDQREMGFKRFKVDAIPAPESTEEKVEDSLAHGVATASTAAAPVYLEGEELVEYLDYILEEPHNDTPLDSLASGVDFSWVTMDDNAVSSTAAADPVYLENEELMARVNFILDEPLKDIPLELEEKVDELVKYLNSELLDSAQDY